MSENRLKRRKLRNKLFTKNRLVILNEETFEELFSFKLNLMNVFISVTIGAILLISFTTYIIAFTPLREFIPGYSSSKLKRDATELALKSDSLTLALQRNEAYIKSIQKVLTGELEYAKFNKDSILASSDSAPSQVNISASKEELELRNQVAKEEKNNLPKAKKNTQK
ncbi:peptidase [Flavobacterium soyangense]|uniref:Peptidase n=1 Tax=Flavobacterium soyangense TaxID=2023265 RepID=A0A930XTA0_9FLAO|nr:peptidase [Flavobacterium soyangense]MBF2707250.1 peptidase [Flavobacterium soyangense]